MRWRSNIRPSTTEHHGGSWLLPAGHHPAVLMAVIDLGTHSVEWLGVVRPVRQTLLCWQVGLRRPDGTPHVVSEPYKLSRTPHSRLLTMISRWRGVNYFPRGQVRLEELLGKTARLTISRAVSATGRTYARLDRVAALPRSESLPIGSFNEVLCTGSSRGNRRSSSGVPTFTASRWPIISMRLASAGASNDGTGSRRTRVRTISLGFTQLRFPTRPTACSLHSLGKMTGSRMVQSRPT